MKKKKDFLFQIIKICRLSVKAILMVVVAKYIHNALDPVIQSIVMSTFMYNVWFFPGICGKTVDYMCEILDALDSFSSAFIC